MASNNGVVSEELGSSSSSNRPQVPIVIPRSSITYTPFFCEENVYFLCKSLCMRGIADHKGTDLFVVFISNEEQEIPLWHQKASKTTDGLVIWDYHVICIQAQKKDEGGAHHIVWDLDSTLPCPISLPKYIDYAICPSVSLDPACRRLFRVIHAPLFLQFFASDRSHMKDPSGDWMAAPPINLAIVAEDGTKNNLKEYMKMRAADILENGEAWTNAVYSNKYGVVLSERMLARFFSQINPPLLHQI